MITSGLKLNSKDGTAAEDTVALGEAITVTNTDGNLVATHDDNQIIYDLAKDISVESVTAGTVDPDTGELVEGIQLTATGTEVKDADGNVANYGADKAEISDGTNTTTTTAGGTTVTDGTNTNTITAGSNSITDGKSTTTVGADTITVGAGSNPVVINGQDGVITGLTNTTLDDIDDTDPTAAGQAATQGQVSELITSGLKLNSKDGTAAEDTVALGEAITVTNTDGNLVATHDDNQIIYDLAKDISVESLTATDPTTGSISKVDGNSISQTDTLGNSNTSTATGNSLEDTAGNTTTSVAGSSTYSDVDGNETIASATGTDVTDQEGNNASYGAKGAEIADKAGNSTSIGAGIITVQDTAGTTNITGDNITVGGASPVTVNGKAGTVNGLTNTKFDPEKFVSGQAATEDQVAQVANDLSTDLTDTGFNITTQNAGGTATAEDKVKLGETVNFTNTDENLVVSTTGNNDVIYDLAKDINVESLTAADPTTGSISKVEGNSISQTDTAGNSNISTATGNSLEDVAGNTTTSVAGSSTYSDVDGNQTIASATGTDVRDQEGNNASYGAKGAEITDKAGNNATIGAGTITVQDAAGTTNITGDNITVGGTNPVTVNGAAGTVNGLTNKTFDSENFISGQAATEDQVAQVANDLNTDLTDKGFNITTQNVGGTATEKDKVKLGETVNFTNSDENLVVSTTGNNDVIYDLAKDINVESLTAADPTTGSISKVEGNSISQTDTAGNSNISTATGNSLEDVAGNTTISVAGSTTYKDIDGNQTIASATGTDVRDQEGNNASYGAKGAEITDKAGNNATIGAGTITVQDAAGTTNITGDNITVGGTNPVTVNGTAGTVNGLSNTTWTAGQSPVSGQAATEDQIAALETNLTNTGFDVGANVLSTTDGKAPTHKLGNQLDIVAGDLKDTAYVATNLSTEVSQNADGKTTVKVGLAKDASFDSVTAGDTVVDNSGVKVVETDVDGKATGKETTLTAGGTSVKDGTNTTTTTAGGVATDGTVKVVDGAGNTVAQVDNTALTVKDKTDPSKVETSINEAINTLNSNQSTLDELAVKYDSTTKDKVTLGGVGSTTPVQLTNVASAGDYTDTANALNAVNAGDLNNAVLDVTNKGLSFAGDTGTNVQRKLGETTKLVGGVIDTSKLSANNIGVVADGADTLTIQLAKDLVDLDSATAGTGTDKTVLNKDGLTVTSGNGTTTIGSDKIVVGSQNSIIIDSKTNIISGLAAGSLAMGSTDAVNGNQIRNIVGNGAFDTAVGNEGIIKDIGGTGATNIHDAIQSINTTVNKGWNLNTNGADQTTIKAEDTVDIGTAEDETNLTVIKKDNKIDFSLNKDLKGLTSVETTDGAGNTSIQTATGTTVINTVGDRTEYGANGTTINGSNGQTVILSSNKVDVGGNTINNVADAVDGKDAVNKDQVEKFIADASTGITTKGFALTAEDGQTINKKLGESVEVVGDENNLTTEVKEGKLAIKLADDLNVNSITAGDSVLNTAGLTVGNTSVTSGGVYIIGGPSVTIEGISAGNKTITNVADAKNDTDAVNKGQLDSAINGLDSKVNEIANNAVQYDAESKDKVTLAGANGTTLTNVKDGEVSQGSKDAVNGGQLWNVQQQVDRNTNDITNIQTDIQNINNGKSGLVQQENSTAQITVGKDTGGTSVNIKGTDGDRVLTGVAAGAVNATSTDAVNGSQLNTTNQAVVEYLGGGAAYDNITGSFNAPSYTVGDQTYNKVGTAIDALNQADQVLNSKIDNVSNNLEQAFKSTNQRINDVEKRANAGIAAAIAFEAAPYVPGKLTYSAGAAYHGGENAVGVTLRKTADNGRWSLTGGIAAASEGDPSVRIGISGVID
ncbi:hypothetical protein G8D99_15320 [Acinetobacter lanii]|uniref:YadA-like family protein n=1 Tax=Acinetobacter lanii TaxID=2715163 RepID=A0A6G8S813_9GAMM|nr:YadA-like family protein [Acinetobacter lanii]QIO10242.1 hypothetical protein G8D99_15320 [Acinetobacter lanii]